MGMDLNVYRVDFDRLARIPGCRSERLLQQLIQFYEVEDEEAVEGDDDEECEPEEQGLSVRDALRNVLFGTISDRTPDPAYSQAMALIYPAIAAHIGDLRVAGWGIEAFFRDADVVLTRRGFPGYFSALVFAGCPLDVPVEAEPALGFISPAECERFGQEYSGHNWSAEEPSLQEVVEDLKTWCAEAARHRHGLVGVAP